MQPKAIFNWSGGKDSSLCLYHVLKNQDYAIQCLLTSVSETYQRISMHGVRVELLDIQAERLGLPLIKLQIPDMPSMEVYEQVMQAALKDLQAQGASVSIFGDIFLEDLRQYREQKLAEVGLKGVFPLWNRPTKDLIREFIALGFKTITTCVNEKYLDESFVGRIIDEDFLNDLPDTVDPCGENGEFHTFVFDGPLFSKPILFEKGEVVYRKYTPQPKNDDDTYDCNADDTSPYQYGFWYCDLIPV